MADSFGKTLCRGMLLAGALASAMICVYAMVYDIGWLAFLTMITMIVCSLLELGSDEWDD